MKDCAILGSTTKAPRLAGVSDVITVPHQAVANAVGAAIAQVSGEVDQIFQHLPREEAPSTAREAWRPTRPWRPAPTGRRSPSSIRTPPVS